jgi:hypothetical protein
VVLWGRSMYFINNQKDFYCYTQLLATPEQLISVLHH